MDDNDEARHYALLTVAGVIALTIAIVLMVAARTGLGMHRAGGAAAPGTAAAEAQPAVVGLLVGQPDGAVYFALDSEALPADANEVLVRVADLARANDGKVVLISGFHDASGDMAHNAELARHRAEAVRHALEANGVAPDHLVLDKPAVTTGGADPREARRVELRLR